MKLYREKIILFLFVFCLSNSLMAKDTKDLSNIDPELQRELNLAEADVNEDEDLFMDDGEDKGEDWSDEEPTDVAEEPSPDAEEVPDSIPVENASNEEESTPEPKAAPVTPPAPKKVAPKKAPIAKVKKETPAHKQVSKKSKARVPASFKQGFKTPSSDCSLYSEPNTNSKVILSTKGGKKIWLEGVNETWYKGFHKGGHGYFPSSCF
jgi:hypothetical protein